MGAATVGAEAVTPATTAAEMVDFRVFIALDKSAGVKAGGAGGGSGVTGVATEAEASGWNKVPVDNFG